MDSVLEISLRPNTSPSQPSKPEGFRTVGRSTASCGQASATPVSSHELRLVCSLRVGDFSSNPPFSQTRIAEGLLNARFEGMVVVLGLDDGQRDALPVLKDVVRPSGASSVPAYPLPPDDDAARGDGVLLPDLLQGVPPGLFDGVTDELVPDFGLVLVLLRHHQKPAIGRQSSDWRIYISILELQACHSLSCPTSNAA